MTVSKERLRSGADRGAVRAALAAGEGTRCKTLSVTLSLMVAAGLMIGLGRPLGDSIVQPLLGIAAAAAVWRISNFMWRPIAIAIAAPLVGKKWGQSRFDVGLAAIDWTEWWEALGLRGHRLVAWRSSGSYGDIHYSLQEVTVRIRRHKARRSNVTYHLRVSIALPSSFAGTLDILPAGGLIADLDGALRKVTGADMQRVRVGPQFDGLFDTLATADAVVDNLLTQDFCAIMTSLAQHHHALAGRFSNGGFTLYLTVPDVSFRGARLSRPLPDLIEEADQLWWELTVPHRLIDAVLGNHRGPLR